MARSRLWPFQRSINQLVPRHHPFGYWTGATLAVVVSGLVIVAGLYKDPGEPGAIARFMRLVRASLLLDHYDATRLALGALLLVLALYLFRRGSLAWLALRPGPIEINRFADLAPGNAPDGEPFRGAPVDDILAEFRRTLSDQTIKAPPAVPGDATEDSFLQSVRTGVGDAGNVASVVAGLLSAVYVKSGYRVTGTLHHRSAEDRPFGMTVTVSSLAGRRSDSRTLWAETWTQVATSAGYFVAAFILPQSRRCRQPPWTAWRGSMMRYELYEDYQQGAELLEERRYEEALKRFYRSLKNDPQNPYLRIFTMQAKEQLGLALEAAAGYASIVEIEGRYEGAFRTRSRNGRAALLIARYRLTIKLCDGQRLAAQWLEPTVSTNPLRQEEAQRVRAELGRILERWYEPFLVAYGRPRELPAAFDEFIRRCREDGDRALLTVFLRYVGFRESYGIVASYALRRRRGLRRLPISQPSLRILRAWSRIHLHQAELVVRAQSRCHHLECGDAAMMDLRARLRGSGRTWPPQEDVVRRLLRREMGRRATRWGSWQEYYNAACTYAVVLQPVRQTDRAVSLIPEGDRDAPATFDVIGAAAVAELVKAVKASDSGYVAAYAQWLATGDPDLDGLRASTPFLDFLDAYFPDERFRDGRPGDLPSIVQSYHEVRLLAEFAALAHDFFAEDGVGRRADENDARRLVVDYIEERSDWRCRAELAEMIALMARRLGRPVTGAFPFFQDDPAASAFDRRTTSGSEAPSWDVLQQTESAVLGYRRRQWEHLRRRNRLYAALRGRRYWTNLQRGLAPIMRGVPR